jgi:hypothetical protein
MGKPALELTEEQKQLAIDLAASGETLKGIREALMVDQTAFRNYLERHPVYKDAFVCARQDGLEELADSLQKIPDEVTDVQRARLKSDNLRWLLSKRKAHVYGDRLDLNITQTVDIAGALLEARSRASLPPLHTNAIVEAESSTITDTSNVIATDKMSVDDLLS